MIKRKIYKSLFLLLIVIQIMNITGVLAQEESEIPAVSEQQENQQQVNDETPVDDEGQKEKEEPVNTYVKVTGLDVADYQKEMEVGDKQLLMVTVLPIDATEKKVTYSSSKEEVATVNELGRITAVKSGTARITIEAADGVKEQLNIKVNKVQ
ncbi:MAG: Ig domain-containing protein [Clostridiaceae bacterium]|nr:Ig domain-containing protein [Clostridiaceae bacterium]